MKTILEIVVIGLCLFPIVSKAVNCDKFYDEIYQRQLDRQHGIYHKPKHSTKLWSAVSNHMWQTPLWASESRKEKAAANFAREFKRDCKTNRYGD